MSPAIGAGIIPGVGYIFPSGNMKISHLPFLPSEQRVSLPIMAERFRSAARLFMKENTYAVTTLYFEGNINYNLYGIGTRAGKLGDLMVLLNQHDQPLLW